MSKHQREHDQLKETAKDMKYYSQDQQLMPNTLRWQQIYQHTSLSYHLEDWKH